MSVLSFFVIISCLFFNHAFAFSFTTSTPSECDNLSVEWEGGTGPFTLLFVPVFGTPRNVSIPATAITGTKGSFSTPMLFPADQKLVITMSDSTGFGSGGTTPILTVEPSKGGSCDTSDPGVAFSFQLNQALQQCRPFLFEGYGRAVQPVTISMVIPGGEAAVVRPPPGGPQFNWVANIPAGNSVIFMMTDARGGQGGASDIRIVGASDDSSCINDNSPSSTLRPTTSTPTQTSTTPSQTSGSTQTSTSQASEGTPISAIAGTVIGSLLFLAVIVTLGLFFLKNLKKKSDRKKQQATDFHHSKPSAGTFYESTGSGPNPYGSPQPPYPPYAPSPNTAAPFHNPFSDSSPMADPNMHYPYQQPDPFNTPRPYYPPPPLVPASQDPFNPTESTLPGAMNYSTSAPIPPLAMDQTPSLTREPSSSQYNTSQPAKDDGFTQPPGQRRERRRQQSRGFNVTNPSPPQQNAALPHPNTSPFM